MRGYDPPAGQRASRPALRVTCASTRTQVQGECTEELAEAASGSCRSRERPHLPRGWARRIEQLLRLGLRKQATELVQAGPVRGQRDSRPPPKVDGAEGPAPRRENEAGRAAGDRPSARTDDQRRGGVPSARGRLDHDPPHTAGGGRGLTLDHRGARVAKLRATADHERSPRSGRRWSGTSPSSGPPPSARWAQPQGRRPAGKRDEDSSPRSKRQADEMAQPGAAHSRGEPRRSGPQGPRPSSRSRLGGRRREDAERPGRPRRLAAGAGLPTQKLVSEAEQRRLLTAEQAGQQGERPGPSRPGRDGRPGTPSSSSANAKKNGRPDRRPGQEPGDQLLAETKSEAERVRGRGPAARVDDPDPAEGQHLAATCPSCASLARPAASRAWGRGRPQVQAAPVPAPRSGRTRHVRPRRLPAAAPQAAPKPNAEPRPRRRPCRPRRKRQAAPAASGGNKTARLPRNATERRPRSRRMGKAADDEELVDPSSRDRVLDDFVHLNG